MHVQVVDEGEDALTHGEVGHRAGPVPRVVVDDGGQVAKRDEGGVELVGDLGGRTALALGYLFLWCVRAGDAVGDIGSGAHGMAGDVADRPSLTPRRLLPLPLVERSHQGAEGVVLRQEAGDRLVPSESHAAAPSF